MNIKEYESTLKEPLRQVTITLLLRENQILLAMKKRGFGAGKWNGVGGKANDGEDVVDAAIRETHEEIGVIPNNLELVGTINFYHPFNADGKGFNQQVNVYLSRDWDGEPVETDEMNPQWFEIDEIPYKEMWWDDEIWFPIILKGSKVKASFMFDENEKIIDQIIEEVQDFGGKDQNKL
ncbi:MAG: NUDIX hydrolase [uncultured bacterium]|nr:MAG: NUDIX hydrolase [uncultured bacterium]